MPRLNIITLYRSTTQHANLIIKSIASMVPLNMIVAALNNAIANMAIVIMISVNNDLLQLYMMTYK